MVNLATGMNREHVRSTTTSHNMAAILQLIKGHAALVAAYIFDIGHKCYGQLTAAKTRYPLASITLPYRGLRFRAHRGRVGRVFFRVDR